MRGLIVPFPLVLGYGKSGKFIDSNEAGFSFVTRFGVRQLNTENLEVDPCGQSRWLLDIKCRAVDLGSTPSTSANFVTAAWT